jgi:beclin 1
LFHQEEHYWREYSRHKHQLLQAEDEYRSLDSQLRATQCQLEKLKKTNVFNATFHIWHAGHFGTINGFRLGRLPSVPVDWNEVNTAWGRNTIVLHPDIFIAGLRVRIHFIRIRIQHFRLNTSRDPGL